MRDRRVVLEVARIGREILRVAELRGVDEEARDEDVRLGARRREERLVAGVQRAHRRHEPDHAAPWDVELCERLHDDHGCVASTSAVVERLEPAAGERCAMALDRLPVAARNRPGQLEAVLDRPLHQRHERRRRRARRVEELGGGAVERDEVVGRDGGAGVVERAAVVGEHERAQPERLREPARRARGPPRRPR